MFKNILITGANGQLGSELRLLLKAGPREVFFTDVDELDITDKKAIRSFVSENKVECIINSAAYTAVDKAEDETEKANSINHVAVKNLATIAKENNINLVHVSTDYVFPGTSCRPYNENDEPDPIGVYGKTKLQGEQVIIDTDIKYIILRTSWLYSSFGSNFVKTIMRLANERNELTVIADQVGSPTYARDLARAIVDIINNDEWKNGIYHYANEGVCSWYDFAKAIIDISGSKCKLIPCRTDQYPTKAKRPFYSVFDKSKIKEQFKIFIPNWRDSLSECICAIKNNI